MNFSHLKSNTPSIFSREEEAVSLAKALGIADPSAIGSDPGVKGHPYIYSEAKKFREFNAHHATCIGVKVEATVGQGFRSDKVESVLDPLSTNAVFSGVFTPAVEEYYELGTGYVEVVRASDDGAITGLHHVPSDQVRYYWEDNSAGDWHYEVRSNEGTEGFRKFARFGDLDGLRERWRNGEIRVASPRDLPAPSNVEQGDDAVVAPAELLDLRMPTSRNPYYGWADYLAAVPMMELQQCIMQHNFDYFFNRAVPEFLLFLLGEKIESDDWQKLVDELQTNQGLTNSRKSMAVNLPSDELTVQMERLGLTESSESNFVDHTTAIAMNIMSVHSVPPILGGVLVPGKMGAANEMTNAMAAFQVLKVGPNQRRLSQYLACTLGQDRSLGLSKADFVGKKEDRGNGFRTIIEEIAHESELLAAADTMARMREPIVGSGRDTRQGTLQNGRQRSGAR